MSELIKGLLVDDESRCEHWHNDLDIIALKFKCCPGVYYSCFDCHEALTKDLPNHKIERYSRAADDSTKLIICGVCKTELTFKEYSETLTCKNCHSPFNPGCALHYDHYFDK